MSSDQILSKITDQLMRHEGLRLHPYVCTAGKLTIGVGRNLTDAGISRDEAMMMLRSDVADAVADLHDVFPEFNSLPEPVQIVLTNMRFNLGPHRFRGFRRMISAVTLGDYRQAADEMRNSKWFRQVKGRGEELCEMMKNAGGVLT